LGTPAYVSTQVAAQAADSMSATRAPKSAARWAQASPPLPPPDDQ